ncbi:hypothetical protein NMD1_03563 [Novosphingobium sp. MD-1]|nr:hypothetical protein NMD1_03563 [Novosphingobium sp. MD-1]
MIGTLGANETIVEQGNTGNVRNIAGVDQVDLTVASGSSPVTLRDRLFGPCENIDE